MELNDLKNYTVVASPNPNVKTLAESGENSNLSLGKVYGTVANPGDVFRIDNDTYLKTKRNDSPKLEKIVTDENIQSTVDDLVNKALENKLVPPGTITTWSGYEDQIPIGWTLCDGCNTTNIAEVKSIINSEDRSNSDDVNLTYYEHDNTSDCQLNDTEFHEGMKFRKVKIGDKLSGFTSSEINDNTDLSSGLRNLIYMCGYILIPDKFCKINDKGEYEIDNSNASIHVTSEWFVTSNTILKNNSDYLQNGIAYNDSKFCVVTANKYTDDTFITDVNRQRKIVYLNIVFSNGYEEETNFKNNKGYDETGLGYWSNNINNKGTHLTRPSVFRYAAELPIYSPGASTDDISKMSDIYGTTGYAVFTDDSKSKIDFKNNKLTEITFGPVKPKIDINIKDNKATTDKSYLSGLSWIGNHKLSSYSLTTKANHNAGLSVPDLRGRFIVGTGDMIASAPYYTIGNDINRFTYINENDRTGCPNTSSYTVYYKNWEDIRTILDAWYKSVKNGVDVNINAEVTNYTYLEGVLDGKIKAKKDEDGFLKIYNKWVSKLNDKDGNYFNCNGSYYKEDNGEESGGIINFGNHGWMSTGIKYNFKTSSFLQQLSLGEWKCDKNKNLEFTDMRLGHLDDPNSITVDIINDELMFRIFKFTPYYDKGEVGGEYSHKLNIGEIPTHHHSDSTVWFNDSKFNYAPTDETHLKFHSTGWGGDNTIGREILDSGNTGGSVPHNNLPPYYALCYIMKVPYK